MERKELQLPVLVFGTVEVRRLKREVESLEEFISQAKIREPGKQDALPRVSRLLDALAADNGRNLLQADDRKELKEFLQDLEQTAPQLHISFASDPSSSFTAKLVTWLRANIHTNALLTIGLQPTIAAGCIVRSPNKVFDFSLRQHLSDQKSLLIEALDKQTAPTQPEASNG
jgi:F0F1-type ATP synthase delta subunit